MKYVYLLRAGTEHYKVGVASDVFKRVKGLQTSNPSVIDIVTCKLVDDPYALEHQIHSYLEQMRAGGGKEWFTLSAEQAIALAILINKLPGVDLSQQITVRTILGTHTKHQESIVEMFETITKKLKNVPLDKQTYVPMSQVPHRKREGLEDLNLNKIENTIDEVEIYRDALRVLQDERKASTSLLQRKLRIGYGRAASLIDQFEDEGLVTGSDGNRPRGVRVQQVTEKLLEISSKQRATNDAPSTTEELPESLPIEE